MSFWDLAHPGHRAAIVAAASGETWSYGRLADEVGRIRTRIPALGRKRLGLVLGRNVPVCIAGYLAGLQEGDAVWLLDAGLAPELLGDLLARYRPDWIFAPESVDLSHIPGIAYVAGQSDQGYRVLAAREPAPHALHGDLGVLLSTSGTTGSTKLVRLAAGSVQANADSIRRYLAIGEGERPITTLPLAYSYGLSVVNSHLLAGATLLLTDEGLTSRAFWDFFRSQEATSMAGVPYIYQTLERMRLGRMALPSLRTLTQAGGRLDVRLIRLFAELAGEKGWRFFVMYGQTEATARISFVPHDRALEKAGTIGVAIPDGALSVADDGEIMYRGPNVMLGYASEPADLALGDELGGVLATGDIGVVDDDEFFAVTGRKKRFIKIVGLRVNLDDVERSLEARCQAPAVCFGSDDALVVAAQTEPDRETIRHHLTEVYHLHPTAFDVRVITDIPRLPSGKVDYSSLAAGVGV